MLPLGDTLCIIAWVVAVASVPFIAWRLRHAPRTEVGVVLAISIAAFAVRLMVPFGPLNAVDAGRLSPLWEHDSWWADDRFRSVPMALGVLRHLGVTPAFLLRYWGPIIGGLSIPVTYLCARIFTLTWGPAALAATLVATWPGLIHYTAGPELSAEAGLLGTAAFAVAAAVDLGIVTLPLLASLTTLTIYSRPEFRLIVIPLGILLSASAWSWRRRLMLAALLAVPIAGYLPQVLHPEIDPGGGSLLATLVVHPLAYGLPWIVAAIAGVLVGNMPTRIRFALGLAFAMFAGVYYARSHDASLEWNEWRYLCTVVPWIAIAAGFLVDRLGTTTSDRIILASAFALALVPLFAGWGMLQERYAEQAEFAFVRDTAARAAPPGTTIYLLGRDGFGVAQSAAMLGLSDTFGPVTTARWNCEAPRPVPTYHGPSIVLLDKLVERCPETVSVDNSVLFLGLTRSDPHAAATLARYDLEPIIEHDEMVVPDGLESRASSAFHGTPGMSLHAFFGWYRLHAVAGKTVVSGAPPSPAPGAPPSPTAP